MALAVNPSQAGAPVPLSSEHSTGAGFSLVDVPGAQLFFALYWFMTALHALHLLIGIGVFGAFAVGVQCRRRWAPARRIEGAALYWHFVDVVWVFFYPLLYLIERHR